MTQVNKIDVADDGTLFIRFLKDDGGWHRTCIPPNIDAAVQLEAVNNHLEAMGRTRIQNTDRNVVVARAAVEHTAEVRRLFREKVERMLQLTGVSNASKRE